MIKNQCRSCGLCLDHRPPQTRYCSPCYRKHANAKRKVGGSNFKPVLPVGKENDKRRKLTAAERVDIKRAHDSGRTIRSIAREYSFVSRRLIQFVIFPERDAKLKATVKKEKRWNKYYHKDIRKMHMRKHRANRRAIGLGTRGRIAEQPQP